MMKINSDDLAGLGILLFHVQEAIAKNQPLPETLSEDLKKAVRVGFDLIAEFESKPKKSITNKTHFRLLLKSEIEDYKQELAEKKQQVLIDFLATYKLELLQAAIKEKEN